MTKPRVKWIESNHLNLYKIFFGDFTTEGYHSLGLILEYLENISFYEIYEQEIISYYTNKKDKEDEIK